MSWFVYIVQCNDGTLYTGITTDVQRRIVEHNLGKGAKYTRGRNPVLLLGSIGALNRSEASKIEVAVKRQRADLKLDFLLKQGTECGS